MLPPTEGIQLKSHWSLGRHQSLPSFPHLLLSNRRKVYFTLFFLCFSCCFIENWCCDSVRNRPQSGFYFLFAFNSWASHRCSCSVAEIHKLPQNVTVKNFECISELLLILSASFIFPQHTPGFGHSLCLSAVVGLCVFPAEFAGFSLLFLCMDSEILDSVISQIKVCFVYFCVWVIVHPMTETWWSLVIHKLSVLKLAGSFTTQCSLVTSSGQNTKSSLNLQIENELLHYDCPISCCFIEM